MLRNELYKTWVVKNDDKPEWGVEIIDGEFSGLVFQIVEFSITEDTDKATLDYHVISKPDGFEENESFRALLELIIMDILREALEIVKNEKN